MKYTVEDDEVVATGKWPKSKKGALNESIKKWEWLVQWISDNPYEAAPYTYAETCALCVLFRDDGKCDGCPVKEKTGDIECFQTPYTDYFKASFWKDNRRGSLSAAKREVKFLKSLLDD